MAQTRAVHGRCLGGLLSAQAAPSFPKYSRGGIRGIYAFSTFLSAIARIFGKYFLALSLKALLLRGNCAGHHIAVEYHGVHCRKFIYGVAAVSLEKFIYAVFLLLTFASN
jgi:hypothetical protein